MCWAAGEGRHTEIQLEGGEEAQVLVKEMVKAPPSGMACVTLTHRRDLLSVVDNISVSSTTTSASSSKPTSDNSLPELQVIPAHVRVLWHLINGTRAW